MNENNQNCHICNANDFYTKEIAPDANILPLGMTAWLQGARYRLRVCGSCGHTQWFVSEAFLPMVKEKFEREE